MKEVLDFFFMEPSLETDTAEAAGNSNTVVNRRTLVRFGNNSSARSTEGGVNCEAIERSSQQRRMENDSKSTQAEGM